MTTAQYATELYNRFINFYVNYESEELVDPIDYDLNMGIHSTFEHGKISRAQAISVQQKVVKADNEDMGKLCHKIGFPELDWNGYLFPSRTDNVLIHVLSGDYTKNPSDFSYIFPNMFAVNKFVSPGKIGVYYKITGTLSSTMPKDFKYLTRSKIQNMTPSSLKRYKFYLTFEERKHRGMMHSYTGICTRALGAHWTYNFLIHNGFSVTQIAHNEWAIEYRTENEQEDETTLQKDVTYRVNEYVDYIKYKHGIRDEKEEAFMRRKYGNGIPLSELRKILEDINNIRKIKVNIIKFLKWKKTEYEKRYINFKAQLQKEADTYSAAGLTKEEIKEMAPPSANKLIAANISMAINNVEIKISEVENITEKELQFNYLEAIDDSVNGLVSILNVEIVNQISAIISSLTRGYQAFSTSFQNIVITGPAGIGKTTIASKLSFIFRKLNIVCTNIVNIVSRSDLVASYLGQTAIKTKKALFESLEGILFIDEAYQVGGCPNSDQYGMEALTEIVNFLDKYIGISIVIVAGYEKEMNECFFERNEGLNRRFPHKFKLHPFSDLQLLKIFLDKVMRSLLYDPFDTETVNIAYNMMKELHTKNLVPNMGGDMLIMASDFIVSYLSTGDVRRSLFDCVYNICYRREDSDYCSTLVDNTARIMN